MKKTISIIQCEYIITYVGFVQNLKFNINQADTTNFSSNLKFQSY